MSEEQRSGIPFVFTDGVETIGISRCHGSHSHDDAMKKSLFCFWVTEIFSGGMALSNNRQIALRWESSI
jgi:hypothetical protein